MTYLGNISDNVLEIDSQEEINFWSNFDTQTINSLDSSGNINAFESFSIESK